MGSCDFEMVDILSEKGAKSEMSKTRTLKIEK